MLNSSIFFLSGSQKLFQIGSCITISNELLHRDKGEVMYTSEKYKDDVMVFSSLLFFLLYIENKF